MFRISALNRFEDEYEADFKAENTFAFTCQILRVFVFIKHQNHSSPKKKKLKRNNKTDLGNPVQSVHCNISFTFLFSKLIASHNSSS